MNALFRYELVRLRPAALVLFLGAMLTVALMFETRDPIPDFLIFAALVGVATGLTQGWLDRRVRGDAHVLHRPVAWTRLHAVRSAAGALVAAVPVLVAAVLLGALPFGRFDWTPAGPQFTPSPPGIPGRHFTVLAAVVAVCFALALFAVTRLALSRRRWWVAAPALVILPAAVVFALIRIESPAVTAVACVGVALAATALQVLDLARGEGAAGRLAAWRFALTWALLAAASFEASLWFRPYAYWDRLQLDATTLGRIRVSWFDSTSNITHVLDRATGTWSQHPSNGTSNFGFRPGEAPIGQCDNVLGARDAWPGTLLDPGPLRPTLDARFEDGEDDLCAWLLENASGFAFAAVGRDSGVAWTVEEGRYVCRDTVADAVLGTIDSAGFTRGVTPFPGRRFRSDRLERLEIRRQGRGVLRCPLWLDAGAASIIGIGTDQVDFGTVTPFVLELPSVDHESLGRPERVVLLSSGWISTRGWFSNYESTAVLRSEHAAWLPATDGPVPLRDAEEVLLRSPGTNRYMRSDRPPPLNRFPRANLLFSHVGPVYADEATVHLRVFDDEYAIVGEDEVRLTPTTALDEAALAFRGVAGAVRPPVLSTLSFLLPAPRDHVEYHARWLRGSAIAGGHMGLYLALSWALSGLLALWTRAVARKRLADDASIRRWTLATLLAGPIGHVAFRLLVPRAPWITCACGVRRPAALAVCRACSADDVEPPAPLLALRA